MEFYLLLYRFANFRRRHRCRVLATNFRPRSHVRAAKNPGGVAPGETFVGDADVLDGYFPAAKINKLGRELLVRGMASGAFRHG